jgi:hypothetical protein
LGTDWLNNTESRYVMQSSRIKATFNPEEYPADFTIEASPKREAFSFFYHLLLPTYPLSNSLVLEI